MDLQRAVEAPRWESTPGTDPDRLHEPFTLALEPGFPSSLAGELGRRGHRIVDAHPDRGGSVQLIERDSAGMLHGAFRPSRRRMRRGTIDNACIFKESHDVIMTAFSRSEFLQSMAATALLASSASGSRKLTVVMDSGLRALDPIVSTSVVTSIHALMVYDLLLAQDKAGKIQPQMASWRVSPDGKSYTFTLRSGLKWHDGSPVTATIALPRSNAGRRSIRWGRS